MPFVRVHDGEEHFGQVLVPFERGAQVLGKSIFKSVGSDKRSVVVCIFIIGPDIVFFEGADGNPVALPLVFGAEGRTHTDPVLSDAVFAYLFDHVTKAVIGAAIIPHAAVHVALLRTAVNDLMQAGDGRDIHIYGSPGGVVVGEVPCQTAYHGVLPLFQGGGFRDAGIRELVETPHRRCQGVYGLYANGLVAIVRGADDGLEGLALVVRGNVTLIDQLAHHAPEDVFFRAGVAVLVGRENGIKPSLVAG